MRLALLVAVGFVAAPLCSVAAAQDTWSGTWTRNEDGVSGSIILEQSGSTVTGRYTWGDGSGRLSGTASGSTLTMGFDETNYQGSITATLHGRSFSGSYTGHNKDSGGPIDGPFNGACASGPCTANGGGSSAPDEPPDVIRILPPGGWGGAACGAGATAAQACKSTTVAPGDGVMTSSPPLGRQQTEAVTHVTGDAATIPIVESIRRDRNTMIRGCIGTFAHLIKVRGDPGDIESRLFLAACIEVAFEIEAKKLAAARPPARAAAAGCALATFDLVDQPLVRRGDRSPPLAVTCERTASGTTIRVRAVKGTLRSIVGPRLDVGVYRSQTAEAAGAVSIRFTRPS